LTQFLIKALGVIESETLGKKKQEKLNLLESITFYVVWIIYGPRKQCHSLLLVVLMWSISCGWEAPFCGVSESRSGEEDVRSTTFPT